MDEDDSNPCVRRMKARPFLAAVLTAALLLLSLGGGFWWLALRQSPLRLQQHPLELPLAARFVPRNALLSLHLLVEPDQLVAYARAVAPPPRRREAAELVANLRDGAFATAGLEYSSELAGWLGPDTSLAVIAPEGSAGPTGWLLALRCREPEGARRFLQRFWQSRSLAGTALQISSYRGMGLISGRGALVGEPSQALATALIDDQLVLIASGRGVLEQALDVSQIDELNQAGQDSLQAAVGRLEGGWRCSRHALRPSATGSACLPPSPLLMGLETWWRPWCPMDGASSSRRCSPPVCPSLVCSWIRSPTCSVSCAARWRAWRCCRIPPPCWRIPATRPALISGAPCWLHSCVAPSLI
ncbi:DUF3352 domain-containing protein [Cyanobium sp. BSA11S]|uniref:DUF3352 domain-containing protein n=1 Tax=Cyanobium sp. BSA11S TaxID=3108224 RepID=UPI003D81948C